jgi:hypothetical protein
MLKMTGGGQEARSTLDFLRETQKYIDQIRKPTMGYSDYCVSGGSVRHSPKTSRSPSRPLLEFPLPKHPTSAGLPIPQVRKRRPIAPIMRGMIRKQLSLGDLGASSRTEEHSPLGKASELVNIRRLVPSGSWKPKARTVIERKGSAVAGNESKQRGRGETAVSSRRSPRIQFQPHLLRLFPASLPA